MRKVFPLLLIVVALGVVQAAEAQSLAGVPRIGFLTHRFTPGRFEAFLKRREVFRVERLGMRHPAGHPEQDDAVGGGRDAPSASA